jgi:hypothetical protein
VPPMKIRARMAPAPTFPSPYAPFLASLSLSCVVAALWVGTAKPRGRAEPAGDTSRCIVLRQEHCTAQLSNSSRTRSRPSAGPPTDDRPTTKEHGTIVLWVAGARPAIASTIA